MNEKHTEGVDSNGPIELAIGTSLAESINLHEIQKATITNLFKCLVFWFPQWNWQVQYIQEWIIWTPGTMVGSVASSGHDILTNARWVCRPRCIRSRWIISGEKPLYTGKNFTSSENVRTDNADVSASLSTLNRSTAHHNHIQRQ